MPKKLKARTRRGGLETVPRIVHENARVVTVAGDEICAAIEVRKGWLRRNRPFFEALIAAGRRGNPQ
jgi:hypothetical protein